MSDDAVRSVPAAEMTGYHDLSDSERGVIVGALEVGHCIFSYSRTTILLVYCEYEISGKISNFREKCGRKKALKERGRRPLTRILKRGRRATLPQIAADFNAGASTSYIGRWLHKPASHRLDG